VILANIKTTVVTRRLYEVNYRAELFMVTVGHKRCDARAEVVRGITSTAALVINI
jgi:hypothetical protein